MFRQNQLWRQANVRLLPSAVLAIGGAVLSSSFGNVRHGDFNHKIIALVGVIIFLIFSSAFLNVLTNTICKIIYFYHVSTGRAAAMQFIMRLLGSIAIFLMTLNLIGVPVGKLLIGGAALGIILGVAAQQALANFFASIVLIISHPFSVGQNITINSGGLGGKFKGTVKDIGLSHTSLELADGTIVLLPNSALLSGASILREDL